MMKIMLTLNFLRMKFFTVFSISFLVSAYAFGQHKNDIIIAETNYLEFYSNYWINLHHFLYQKAKGSQLKKLQQDGNQFLEVGEQEVYDFLDDSQRHDIQLAISYYEHNMIEKDLIRELGRERVWLQDQEIDQPIVDTLFSAAYTKILNQASTVYKTTFWPIHDKQNRAAIHKHIDVIRKLENDIFPKIERLSLSSWPSKTKVRVDLTAYANYAGAYTPTRPKFNLFISSLDPNTENMSFVETVFHESSHLLYMYSGPFRQGISAIYDKNEPTFDYPRNLWHAALFYICGRVVQDEFKKLGIQGYVMLMDERNIFKKYNTPKFKEALESYYQNESTFETAITNMLNDLSH